MLQQKENLGFFKKYILKKENRVSSKWINLFLVVCLIFCYMALSQLLRSNHFTSIRGVFLQLQVMISVYLVVSNISHGYLISVFLNLSAFLSASVLFITRDNYSALSGMLGAIFTLIICRIIYGYSIRLKKKLEETNLQNEEIRALYEEVTATEEELRQQNEKLTEYNQIMQDNEKLLNQLAFFDFLTKLPNRKMIINRLDILISLPKKKRMRFAVVFIDLDNFKKINDTMGHKMGDLLLQSVATRLNEHIFEEDMLGRLGGDEFALIIQRELKDEEILQYVEGLRKLLLAPIMIDNVEIKISASFGISIYPKDGNNASELLKYSDIAMYQVKDSGKDGIQFFDKNMNDDILKKIEFENELMKALSSQELFLVFQPQFDLATKHLRGFEALARWDSKKFGLVSPAKFIPVAEETGYIIPMGEWILKSACQTLNYLQKTYHINPIMSINISAAQIMEPAFINVVKQVINETGINPNYLEFELTESIFVSSMNYVVDVMRKLKDIGIHIALDDFGTGYSSLSYLQMLPIDTLKLDKSFIDTIGQEGNNKQIVGSMIGLMHQLKLSVVAEGVEDDMQLEYLRGFDCDIIQGYVWGKPLKQEQLITLID